MISEVIIACLAKNVATWNSSLLWAVQKVAAEYQIRKNRKKIVTQ